jgi:uncharacterized protein YndB with AHSA1/START domain
MTELGQYVEIDGRPGVRFERTYPHPIDRVWAAVSEPSQLPAWFPSTVEIDPVVGGTVTFSGDPNHEGGASTVLAIDPPTRLWFSWGADELRFDLEAIGEDSCRFVLINLLDEQNAAARNGAGWHVCLAELDKVLRGIPSNGPHSEDTVPWQPLYEGYIELGLPSGAWIPDHVR